MSDPLKQSMENDLEQQATQGVFIDAAFVNPEGGSFTYPEAVRNQSLLMHVSERITCQPGNLRLHMQRIRLAEALSDPEALAEAVGDLFIVLKDKGVELRGNLLKQYWSRLPEDWRNLLRTSFVSGLNPGTPLPGRSRLTAGNLGRRDFVVQADSAHTQTQRIEVREDFGKLETVRDMLDSGQLEAACTMLENWLPEAEEAAWLEGARELARLYRYIDHGEARANAWWDVLWSKSPARAQYWAELLAQGEGAAS